ncbi:MULTISPECIES: ATP-binding protein [unclassified Leptolyngbya]|uniref:ATP-binding protein n=1 Tax=unclassified Leptolyngbya TaxID=2650499 RepID=UPI00168881B1|nr:MULTISPECIES: ATP-binding protein [unclassified Leptolyngbya]MBD1913372.1 ATP-binding protein [Leptolyngbya sp. FACHB-8]MBD2158697.1 ATP-binding protein [Leptolyngbya sp. FACHB-16]
MELHLLRQVQTLQQQMASLVLYQSVGLELPGRTFLALLQTLGSGGNGRDGSHLDVLRAYGVWFSALADRQQTWSAYVLEQLLTNDNPFTRQAQKALTDLPASLTHAAQHDLRLLQSLYRVTGPQVAEWVQNAAGLPTAPPIWDPVSGEGSHSEQAIATQLLQHADWGNAIEDLITYHQRVGVGQFVRYRAFRWQGGDLFGIAHPDPISLEALVGYDLPRQMLLQNTEALLAGYPALHVLLYGSRGSGKSSMVKALLNQYGDRGLRLVEVSRSELRDLVTIVDCLREQPQKFIVFVDDLSFEEDDDAFKALKVVLEGNATARPQNIVVYATSNRRHLIREFMGDRPRPSDADEVHAWDTVQEKLSFSDRFGLTLTFEPANQDTYLAIVRHLAQRSGVTLEAKELEFRALQWATRHNGRSGRTARQFVDFLQAELAIQSGGAAPLLR